MVFVVLTLFLAGCAKAPPPEPAMCTLDNGEVLDATGRADGVYGVEAAKLATEPLVPLAQLQLDESGVDQASGKRWLGFTLGAESAKRVEAFTAEPAGRSVAIVSGGVVASHHKVREPIKGEKVKVSCCDARACEQLVKVMAQPR